jgi:hypothetical protein
VLVVFMVALLPLLAVFLQLICYRQLAAVRALRLIHQPMLLDKMAVLAAAAAVTRLTHRLELELPVAITAVLALIAPAMAVAVAALVALAQVVLVQAAARVVLGQLVLSVVLLCPMQGAAAAAVG